MSILITGGAGFIGSHTAVELLNKNYDIVILDNFVNSKPEVLKRIKKITNKKIKFYQIDLLNKKDINQVFIENRIDAVIHFAGLKAVGESVEYPLRYYSNNIVSTINLCEVMKKFNVKKLVFSSSATVYGSPKKVPILESFPLHATNPYGRTKLIIEDILRDICLADSDWSVTILRYFNPIGAHESGLIGEDPNGIPNNLMPYITQVAIGNLPYLRIYGNKYSTKDGTGVRDYIHVVDLAKGHLAALFKILSSKGLEIYNLGTGKGYSVLEVLTAFEKATKIHIPYRIVDNRPGDVALCYADATKAKLELGWKAERGIEEMCKDSWRWQQRNPNGYSMDER